VGHPHGAPLRHHVGRRDAAAGNPPAARRGSHLPVGDGQSHGTRARVPQIVGLRARRRDHLGQDQPAAAHHPHGEDGPLAEPRQRALPRRNERQSAESQPGARFGRDRGRGARHQPQTGRDLRNDRAVVAGDEEDRAVWAPPQHPAQLDHAGEPGRRHQTGRLRPDRELQKTVPVGKLHGTPE
jgi:hypothetical protein